MGKNYNDLYKNYETLFSNNLDQSIRLFGIECNVGWYDLLNDLMSCIHNHIKHNASLKQNFQVNQIKEKFGGLRFYVSGADEYINGMISLAEKLSYKICEGCGNNQNVKRSTSGWIMIRCQHCIDKDEKLKKSNWVDNNENQFSRIVIRING